MALVHPLVAGGTERAAVIPVPFILDDAEVITGSGGIEMGGPGLVISIHFPQHLIRACIGDRRSVAGCGNLHRVGIAVAGGIGHGKLDCAFPRTIDRELRRNAAHPPVKIIEPGGSASRCDTAPQIGCRGVIRVVDQRPRRPDIRPTDIIERSLVRLENDAEVIVIGTVVIHDKPALGAILIDIHI